MTELADFSPTFRRIVNNSYSVAQVERRLHRELSAGQFRVLADFFQERQRQEQIRAVRIRRVQIVQRRKERIVIQRDSLGRRHLRSASTGRYLAMKHYLVRLRRRRRR
ncbi:MAG: hypothetical protein JRN15_15145 [Nitrososphaerota archaeon]|nr:hypothetical protein [Nitrososphaerota archaeon]